MPARIQLLIEDYAHFLNDADLLKRALAPLLELHGHRVIELWHEMALEEKWELLVTDLLSRHYDPAYLRSTASNFPRLKAAQALPLSNLDETALLIAAQTLIA
jgi:tRNA 2-selenouridine synthase